MVPVLSASKRSKASRSSCFWSSVSSGRGCVKQAEVIEEAKKRACVNAEEHCRVAHPSSGPEALRARIVHEKRTFNAQQRRAFVFLILCVVLSVRISVT